MKKYVCPLCGYEMEADSKPEMCPVCGCTDIQEASQGK